MVKLPFPLFVLKSKIEKTSQPLDIITADRDLCFVAIIHEQFIAAVEPGYDLADMVNVNQETAVGPGKSDRGELMFQFVECAA